MAVLPLKSGGKRPEFSRGSIRGVTLFELIIVVVVTALLVAFFVLSTHFLIVRTKVSRVKEEQRVLVRALQNYQMDYSNLPQEQNGLDALTAPTAYLASVPRDPFDQRKQTYLYFTPDGFGHLYAVVSSGPDGRLDVLRFLRQVRTQTGTGEDPLAGLGRLEDLVDIGDSDLNRIEIKPESWFQTYLTEFTYDPTNGTVSSGDIVSLVVNY